MESFIGFLAAVCTTGSFIPQAVKIYKTKQTRDISAGMFSLMTTGVFLWLVYGFIIGSLPIIGANMLTLIFASYILWMKLKTGY